MILVLYVRDIIESDTVDLFSGDVKSLINVHEK